MQHPLQWKYIIQNIIYVDFFHFYFIFLNFIPIKAIMPPRFMRLLRMKEGEKDLVRKKENDEGRQKMSIDVSVLTGKKKK